MGRRRRRRRVSGKRRKRNFENVDKTRQTSGRSKCYNTGLCWKLGAAGVGERGVKKVDGETRQMSGQSKTCERAGARMRWGQG